MYTRLFTCLLAVLLLSAAGTAPAHSQEGRTLRVAATGVCGLIEQKKDGTYSGYAVDYLNRIAQYSGWRYEYVPCSWEDALRGLNSGEIDLVVNAQRSPERLRRYVFTKLESGVEYCTLYARENNEKVFFQDFSTFSGMRIGLVKESYHNVSMEKYAQQHGFTYIPQFFAATEEARAALDAGKIDGLALGGLNALSGYKTLARFSPTPYYVMANPRNADLIETLDTVMEEIKCVNP